MILKLPDSLRKLAYSLPILALTSLVNAKAQAATEFEGVTGFVEETLADNLPLTTAIAFAPNELAYIALKEGIVRVMKDGKVASEPFIDLTSVTNKDTDRGLLGIAVHPNFPASPYLYLLHTYDPPGVQQDGKGPRVSRLIRVTADRAQGYGRAVQGSEVVLLGRNSTRENLANRGDIVLNIRELNPEPASCMTGGTLAGSPIDDCLPVDGPSHSVGSLAFGSDGSLFVSLGDGSLYDGANALALRSQDIQSLSGKVLRIDPTTGTGLQSNPFFDPSQPSSNRSKVWAMGLRNGFRMAVNPLTNEPYVGDVGSSTWEEINTGKGANFGWPCYEGGVTPGAGDDSGITSSLKQTSFATNRRTRAGCEAIYNFGLEAVRPPFFAYRHPLGPDGKDLGGASAGLAFYTGTTYPSAFHQALFIADYAQRWIKYLTVNSQGTAVVHTFGKESGGGFGPVQLAIGPDTNLYAVMMDIEQRVSEIRRYRYIGGQNVPPVVNIASDRGSGIAPVTIAFNSVGTHDPDGQPLTYTWEFGDGSISTEAHPTHSYTTPGVFNVKLTVSETTSPFMKQTAQVAVRIGNSTSQAVIQSPRENARYRIGDVIRLEGGVAGGGKNLQWSVIQHHNNHQHLVSEHIGGSAQFTVTEHTDDTFYETCLSVKEGENLSDIKCVTLRPEKSAYTFSTTPRGLKIVYLDEEKEVVAPYVADPIVRSHQTIVAPKVQMGRTFVGWSDGVKSAQRSFTTVAKSARFNAVYTNQAPITKLRVSRKRGIAPLQVTLDGSRSKDPEAEPLQYKWKIGRRSMRGEKLRYTFRRPGRYTVTLTTVDKLGAGMSKSVVVKVSACRVRCRK